MTANVYGATDKVSKIGDTMTGTLVINASPALQANPASGAGVAITGSTPGQTLASTTGADNTSNALAASVTGDAYDRVRLQVNGQLNLGPGTATRDTTVGRAAAGVLYTSKNLLVGGSSALGDNGIGELQLANATTAPTTAPTGGVSIYSQAGVLKWVDPTGKAYDLSSATSTVRTVTGNTTANPWDVIEANATGGTITITLPTNTAGVKVTVKKTDSSANAVTISGTVDGVTNPTLQFQYQSIELIADGTNWIRVTRQALGSLVDYPATTDGRYLQKSGGSVSGNLTVGSSGTLGDNGVGELQLADVTAAPTTNPSAGSVVYSASGTAVPVRMRDTSGNVRGLLPAVAIATANQSITSTTTQTASTYLTLAVEANATYLMWGWIVFNGPASNSIAFAFTAPSGATMTWSSGGQNNGVSLAPTAAPTWGTSGTGSPSAVDFFGLLATSATTGALTLTFAQGTSSSTATTLMSNSVLRLERVK